MKTKGRKSRWEEEVDKLYACPLPILLSTNVGFLDEYSINLKLEQGIQKNPPPFQECTKCCVNYDIIVITLNAIMCLNMFEVGILKFW